MDVDFHLVVTAILATLLYPIFGWYSLFALVGGVLIDLDHYIWYVSKTRDWSLARSVRYYTEKQFMPHRPVMNFTHTVEFFICLVILAFVHEIFAVMLIAYILHMLMDFISCCYHNWWGDRDNWAVRWIIRSFRS
jgi:hypothetical protein